jgi:hypothetical protein
MELTVRAALLAEHITDKNIRALNDKLLMRKALPASKMHMSIELLC